MTATSHVVWMAHLRTEEVLFCGESLDTEYAKTCPLCILPESWPASVS